MANSSAHNVRCLANPGDMEVIRVTDKIVFWIQLSFEKCHNLQLMGSDEQLRMTNQFNQSNFCKPPTTYYKLKSQLIIPIMQFPQQDLVLCFFVSFLRL